MVGKLPFSAESIFQLAGMARNGRDGPLRGLSPMASWSGVFQEGTGGLVCTRQTTQYHGAPPFLSHHLSHPAAARGEARTLVGYLFCTFTLAVWKSN